MIHSDSKMQTPTEGLTSAEACGQTPDLNPLYKQTNQYNAFNNLKGRTSLLSTGFSDSYEANFLNNRRQDTGWTYDADGRNTQTETFGYQFDAAGRIKQVLNSEQNVVMSQDYDGNGQKIKHSQGEEKYYLRSSVLGGEVIAELKRVGSTNEFRKDVYVFVGRERIAAQLGYVTYPPNAHIWWLYQNPVTGSMRGNLVWSELDLFGLDVWNSGPETPPEYNGSGILYPVNGDPTDLSGGCTLDGVPVSCDTANGLLGSGAAEEATAASAYYTIRNRTTGQIISSGAYLLNSSVGLGMALSSAFDGSGIISGTVDFTNEQLSGASSANGSINWSGLFTSLFRGTLDNGDNGDTATLVDSGGDSSFAWVTVGLGLNQQGGIKPRVNPPPRCYSLENILSFLAPTLRRAWTQSTKFKVEYGGTLIINTGGSLEVTDFRAGSEDSMDNTLPVLRERRKNSQTWSIVTNFHTHPKGGNVPSGIIGDSRYGDYGVMDNSDGPPLGIIKFGEKDSDIIVYDKNGIVNKKDYKKKSFCYDPEDAL